MGAAVGVKLLDICVCTCIQIKTNDAQRTKRALMQFVDNAGPDQVDQGLHCPLTQSMDGVVYVNEQRMLRSDCMDAHVGLDLCCCS